MLAIVVLFQLCLIAGSQASTGLQFPSDARRAYAVFKGWNAITNGTLTLNFKTKKKNGFLVYEDDKGQCQYIYLSLADGRVRLHLKMGNCTETQTLFVGHRLADGKWHKVAIQRHFRRTTVTVDDRISNTTYSKDHEQYFGVTSDLYVGGIPWYISLNELAFPAIYWHYMNDKFIGCISGIMHTRGIKPLTEAQLHNTSETYEDCLDPCSQSDNCQNGGLCQARITHVGCDCRGTGYEGANCTKVTSSIWLTGDGYIAYQLNPMEESWSQDTNIVAFRVWTNYTDGLILGLQPRSDGDYLFIELIDGKILVKMDLGEGEVWMTGRGVHLNDKSWHWVTFERHERKTTLMIDRKLVASRNIRGKFVKLDVHGKEPKLYFGGAPKNMLTGTESKRNFSGYLQEFYFKDKKILDGVAPSTSEDRFRKVGKVIFGMLPSGEDQIPAGSGSGLSCSELGDDEDGECENSTTIQPTEVSVRSSVTLGSAPPEAVPSGVQAHRSLPQAVPTWIIYSLAVVAALAILTTLFLIYRWNSRYSGSFKPEPASSTVDSPKHSARGSKPRIFITRHEEKI